MRAPLKLFAACLAIAACSEDPAGTDAPPAPVIEAATVSANPHNVLSAVASIRVRGADSVAFRIHDGGGEVGNNITPAVRVVGDSATVPVLGLLPERTYTLRPVAWGPGGAAAGGTLVLTTGSLPEDLPRYAAGGAHPAPGFVVFAAGTYGLVIDNTGRVVWYRRFPNGPGLSFMAQPNGRYVARPATPEAGDSEPWIELDPLDNVTRTLGCALGLQPRLHDMIASPEGDYWLLCDETRTMDLSSLGGVAGARVTGTAAQHISASGILLFHWSPFDHFEITDVDPAERTGANVNWTHGNAIDLDPDGSLILSFRNLGEITKIDARTGAVLWRLGGRRNQFTFDGTPMPAFSRQHSARALAAGELVLLDNLGDPSESRAERYALDEVARSARLIHTYGSTPGVVTQIGGSVQPLAGERTLVSFGTAGRVEEYDATGRVVWRITGGAGYVFRAQRIASLYAPGVETRR